MLKETLFIIAKIRKRHVSAQYPNDSNVSGAILMQIVYHWKPNSLKYLNNNKSMEVINES